MFLGKKQSLESLLVKEEKVQIFLLKINNYLQVRDKLMFNLLEEKFMDLDPEVAWNYGVSYLQGFNLFERKGDITFDFYRTHFQNQVVVDWENPQQISFYNLEGESYANSFQVEVNYPIFEDLNVRFAYKYYDIETDYNSGRLTKPLTPNHRFFANFSYETQEENGKQWKFDMTYNFIGEQRLPDTSGNPIQYQLADYSDSYSLLNAQITKVFSKEV